MQIRAICGYRFSKMSLAKKSIIADKKLSVIFFAKIKNTTLGFIKQLKSLVV